MQLKHLIYFFYTFSLLIHFNYAHSQTLDSSLTSVSDSAIINNDYVVVNKNKTVFNEANSLIETRLIVALSNTNIKTKKRKIVLNRGQIEIFHSDEIYKIKKGNYFEIAIKNSHPKPQIPVVWYEPQKNIVVYEDSSFRVFEERLGPNEDRALHSHLQRVVVRLNNVQLTDPRYNERAKEGKGIQVPNTVKFAEPTEHVVRNLSTIPLFNIVLEFKGIAKNK